MTARRRYATSIRCLTILAAIAPALASHSVHAGSIRYVDDDAPAGGDGTSWGTAYRFLQDALAEAGGGGVSEIRVAQGTYQADRDEANPAGNGDRDATFQLLDGVTLAGGYAGLGAPDPDERDVVLYGTILSGDLAGDDLPRFVNNGENTEHVMTGSGVGATSVIDGFTVTAGNAIVSGVGAGLNNSGGSPTVRHCTIVGNAAVSAGAGMANVSGSSPTVSDCIFSGNFSAVLGGAVVNVFGSSPVLTGCTLTDNSSGSGGGMYSTNDCTPMLTGCSFVGNVADNGGAVASNNNSDLTLTNCTFDQNSATVAGGGMYCTVGSDSNLIMCTFSTNAGDAIAADASAVTATGCTFSGNAGGGIVALESTATIINCTFNENSGVGFSTGEPATVTGCTFSGNSSGGMSLNFVSLVTVTNCVFTGNSSESGGGLAMFFCDAEVRNCTFSGNTALISGGAIYMNFGLFGESPTLTNCTFHGNVAPIGGAISSNTGFAAVNCVFSANAPDTLFVVDASPSITYSCLPTYPGLGNISADPRFSDPTGPDGVTGTADDDLRLSFGSRCIDAGSNPAVPPEVTTDIDGNPRFADDPLTDDCTSAPACGTPPIVDMGAHEFVPTEAGGPGPRLWTNPAGGLFNQPSNWYPDLPPIDADVVFTLPLEYTVEITRPATAGAMRVVDGQLQLDLNGESLALDASKGESLQVGLVPDALAGLSLVDGDVTAGAVRVSGAGDGELLVNAGAALSATTITTLAGGLLGGDGTIDADVINLGRVDPGSAVIGTLPVTGGYVQEQELVNGSVVAGTLRIELAGATPGTHDLLAVTGSAGLGGGLIVKLAGGYVPTNGTVVDVLTAASLMGSTFDVALLPALPDELFMRVVYGPVAGVTGPGEGAFLVVESLPDLIDFDDPTSFPVGSPLSDVVVGDFDGTNGDDLALALPNGAAPGSVLLLLSAGTDGAGNWLGFLGGVQTAVGVEPVALAAGLFDGDDELDLAVANRGDDTIYVLINRGLGNGTFNPPQVVGVDDEPVDVEAGRFGGNPAVDLVVVATNADDNEVPAALQVLVNDGAGIFGEPATVLQIGGVPLDVEPGDIDNRKDNFDDVLVLNQGAVQVILNDAEVFSLSQTFEVGSGALQLVPSDLDDDGLLDVATVNGVDGTLSVALNGGGTYGAVVDLPVASELRSGVALDFEGDGDLDIALISAVDGVTSVELVRNDLNGGTQLTLTPVGSLDGGADATRLAVGDPNGDGTDDLIVLNSTPPPVPLESGDPPAAHEVGPAPAVNVLLNLTGCPADVDGNGVVDVDDLVSIIVAWGCTSPPESCPADVNGDGLVDVNDLVEVVVSWGSCS